MLTEALAALAASGGTALVTAMMTDTWEGVRHQAAKLFGHHGEKEAAEAALEQLKQSRAALAGLAGPELDLARAEQEIVWRTRLRDLLESYPAAEEELRGLVAETQAHALAAGHIEQRVTASDHAQQAVQGQGVMNVTFGRPT